MKSFEYEKWKEKYFKSKIINFYKHLNEEDIKILRKLEIVIENKIYTEYEFDIIEEKLITYYEKDNQLINGVTRKQYNNILRKFDKISDIYKI